MASVRHGPVIFNVYANFTTARKRNPGKLMRMSQIKSQRAVTMFFCKKGLSMLSIDKLNLVRFNLQVAAEDRFEHCAANNESPLISLKIKTLGSYTFVLDQALCHLLDTDCWWVQVNEPDMDITARQCQVKQWGEVGKRMP